jgi:hypothetical protein
MQSDPLDSRQKQNATELPPGLREEESPDSTSQVIGVSQWSPRHSVVPQVYVFDHGLHRVIDLVYLFTISRRGRLLSPNQIPVDPEPGKALD